MKSYIIILFMCSHIVLFGCSNTEKRQPVTKTFLDEIIDFHLEETTKNKYTYQDYLEFTKPFGMWDVRPRNVEEISIGGHTAKPGDVSHYHYGTFCAHFNISKKDIHQPLNDFLEQVHNKEAFYKENGMRYAKQLVTLTMKVIKSNHDIYISHDRFQRVGDVFYENGKYWKYNIPPDSPYVISNKKILLEDTSFSNEDREILRELEDFGVYGVVRRNNAVFVIVDGLLNYSCGYMFSPLPAAILLRPDPLFNFKALEQIEDIKIYFYVSN